MAQVLVSIPREDKSCFPSTARHFNTKRCKNFRETFFRGVELIRVEVKRDVIMIFKGKFKIGKKWLISTKFEQCVNVCFTIRIFSAPGTERIFNFVKRY